MGALKGRSTLINNCNLSEILTVVHHPQILAFYILVPFASESFLFRNLYIYHIYNVIYICVRIGKVSDLRFTFIVYKKKKFMSIIHGYFSRRNCENLLKVGLSIVACFR